MLCSFGFASNWMKKWCEFSQSLTRWVGRPYLENRSLVNRPCKRSANNDEFNIEQQNLRVPHRQGSVSSILSRRVSRQHIREITSPNITKNRQNIFPEIYKKSSKYHMKFSKYLENRLNISYFVVKIHRF